MLLHFLSSRWLITEHFLLKKHNELKLIFILVLFPGLHFSYSEGLQEDQDQEVEKQWIGIQVWI